MENYSLHLSDDEAAAVLRMSASEDWQHLEAYLQRRLGACQNDMANLSTDTMRGLIAQAQGKRIEISVLLSLRENAEKVLQAARSRLTNKPRV